eukprot:10025561-Alexandrium_andersonii.AAC.1
MNAGSEVPLCAQNQCHRSEHSRIRRHLFSSRPEAAFCSPDGHVICSFQLELMATARPLVGTGWAARDSGRRGAR